MIECIPLYPENEETSSNGQFQEYQGKYSFIYINYI